ncbi:unnamed protein product [Heterosigma akashiwo]
MRAWRAQALHGKNSKRFWCSELICCDTILLGTPKGKKAVCPKRAQEHDQTCTTAPPETCASQSCSEKQHVRELCDWIVQKNDNESAFGQPVVKLCQCGVAIEINGGCIHMTCTSCSRQFCWKCNGAWSHGHICGRPLVTGNTANHSESLARAALGGCVFDCLLVLGCVSFFFFFFFFFLILFWEDWVLVNLLWGVSLFFVSGGVLVNLLLVGLIMLCFEDC